ncbi:helix-turn-helix domain-containing protein [Staphylococcus coagulans]|uniref:helix-turn-helix domain-containing protein n=1 Tax=Staphylococcus coagulans TaxID=74706 RepID=UPI001F4C39C2|nr:helix-turn-helix transcriptional regulator [Staphylococcus coagulans]UNB46766.1 helix-turn-helix transcriptional regulator [Staphylococcus coagulans]
MIQVNLREILREKNITLSELSKMTGITMKTLSAFQNQKVESVQFNTIEQITYALNISVEDLITKVTKNYFIDISFDDIFNPSSRNSVFIIKWYENDKFIFNTPVNFYFRKVEIDNWIRYEFTLDKINKSLPKDLYDIPDIAMSFFERNDLLINKNSYLELISYLLVQEYILSFNEDINIKDQFTVDVSNVIPLFSLSNISKDESRFTDSGNVFINNIRIYEVPLTSLDNSIHLTRDNLLSSDKVTANIESLIQNKFISSISIDEETYKRKVYLKFN